MMRRILLGVVVSVAASWAVACSTSEGAASREAWRYLKAHFIRCGDSWYARTNLPFGGGYTLWQLRGLEIAVKSTSPTDVDKANGIQWKGGFTLNGKMLREWRSADQKWEPWREWPDTDSFLAAVWAMNPLAGELPYEFTMVLRDETWQIQRTVGAPLQSLDARPLTCDEIPSG